VRRYERVHATDECAGRLGHVGVSQEAQEVNEMTSLSDQAAAPFQRIERPMSQRNGKGVDTVQELSGASRRFQRPRQRLYGRCKPPVEPHGKQAVHFRHRGRNQFGLRHRHRHWLLDMHGLAGPNDSLGERCMEVMSSSHDEGINRRIIEEDVSGCRQHSGVEARLKRGKARCRAVRDRIELNIEVGEVREELLAHKAAATDDAHTQPI